VTRRYKVNARLTQTQLEQGEYIPSDGYVDPETGAEYVGYEYDSEVGYPLLSVTFEARLEPKAEYDQHTYTYERDIEQHPSFRMNWRYELYSSDADEEEIPAWWNTATTKEDALSSEIWAWSKTGAPSGYPYLKAAVYGAPFPAGVNVKTGITSYLELAATITKRKVYTKQNDTFRAWGDTTGQLLAPAVVIGLLPNRNNWLIRDVRIIEDKGSWAMTVEFLYAAGDGWDDDIYEDSAITTDDL
jgi:hypothetical protein